MPEPGIHGVQQSEHKFVTLFNWKGVRAYVIGPNQIVDMHNAVIS